MVLELPQNTWGFSFHKSFQNTEICAVAVRAFAYFEPIVGPLHRESQSAQPPKQL